MEPTDAQTVKPLPQEPTDAATTEGSEEESEINLRTHTTSEIKIEAITKEVFYTSSKVDSTSSQHGSPTTDEAISSQPTDSTRSCCSKCCDACVIL